MIGATDLSGRVAEGTLLSPGPYEPDLILPIDWLKPLIRPVVGRVTAVGL